MSFVKIEISIPEERKDDEADRNPKTGEYYSYGEELARNIRKALIDANLSTNGHISHTYNTSYKWEGKMHEREERTLTLKVDPENVQDIAQIVTAMHPYKTVPITMTDIHSVTLDYEQWLQDKAGDDKHQSAVPTFDS